MADGLDGLRLGQAVQVLRWLASQLASDRHPLAHVPQQVASALLAEPEQACRLCGGELPPRLIGAGRPRVRCETCSPPRRKSDANPTMAA